MKEIPPPCRELPDADGVTFLVHHQLSRGWRMAAGGSAGGAGPLASMFIDHHQHLLRFGVGVIAVAGAVALVYAVGGAFANAVLRIDRTMLTVRMGARQRDVVRIPTLEIEGFSTRKVDGVWALHAVVGEGREAALSIGFGKAERAPALIRRLEAALVQVRNPTSYRME